MADHGQAGRTVPLGRASSSTTISEPPSRTIGEWTIIRGIATGGFGSVFEAHRERDDQLAALKLLHASLAGCADLVARFRREADVLARLHHPAIVELIDSGVTDDGRPYLCMELLGGSDAAAVTAARGPLPAAEVLAIVEAVCAALAVAHREGVIHRDVKASNVMLAPGPGPIGRPVLLDFGIAKLLDALALDLTAAREAVGTPACMAPEQIRGGAIDARTDVYGVGGLAFHLLTGRLPFDEPSPTMAQYLHLHARRPRPSRLAAVPPGADAVVARAMAIDPANRFATPDAVFAALRAALRDSRPSPAVRELPTAALLVAVGDGTRGAVLDAGLLDDREAVLLAAERALAADGWQLAIDLGASAVFVLPDADPAAALATTLRLADQLEHRPGRDPRVEVAIHLHRAHARFAGAELESGAVSRPEAWGGPEDEPGVFVTAAALLDAQPGERYRRLR